MSSTLHVGIWICRKLTQSIKDLIKEYDEISSYNLQSRKNEGRTTRLKNTCVVQVPLAFSPLLCYTKLHRHNNELCCLGAKKSVRLAGQFAGHQIQIRGKLHKGEKSTILNATSQNNNNSHRNISDLFKVTI